MTNFQTPYFSRDIAEFWRRWHISLSTWFRDYVYIPLGGSRSSSLRRVMNVMVIFLVSGLWHGANWTFVIWGALNAVYFIPLMLAGINRNNTDLTSDRQIPSIRESILILITFIQTTLAWIVFRSRDLEQAIDYLASLFLKPWSVNLGVPLDLRWTLILVMLAVEWMNRNQHHPFAIGRWPRSVRWTSYLSILALTLTLFESKESFIYFQF